MNTRSKSTLFLIEQLIVVAVFAISAAACITILASAYFTSVEMRDLRKAILVAENVAETFKATNGSTYSVAIVLGGEDKIITKSDGDELITTVYYDSDWQVTYESIATYKLELTQAISSPDATHRVVSGEVAVSKLTGEEILYFPVAARELRVIGGDINE